MAGQTVRWNSHADYPAWELFAVEGTDASRSGVGIPIFAGDRLRGFIVLENHERDNAFDDADVRLLSTLAAGMGVALENARLFDAVQKSNARLSESLERESASNDILRVIAESPTDIKPVLDTIARHAAQLSGSDDAIVGIRDGDTLLVAAHHGDIPMIPVGEGIRFNSESVAGRAIVEGRTIQAIHGEPGPDSEYPEGDAVAKRYGYRVTCAVPLMREGEADGMIGIRRVKPELLDEQQIAVIDSFAQSGGYRARQRPSVQRDQAIAEGDRAAKLRARGHQQHSAGDGGRARLPGDRRSRRRQAARAFQNRGHVDSLARRGRISCTRCMRTSTASG